MHFTDDELNAFVGGDFVDTVQLCPQGAPVSTIQGIFDNPDTIIQFELGIESSKPTFLTKASDVSTVLHGDVLVVNGISYFIRGGPHYDGNGLATLILSLD